MSDTGPLCERLDWDSVDPIPDALAELMRRPGPVDVPLDDVVPGEPEPVLPGPGRGG